MTGNRGSRTTAVEQARQLEALRLRIEGKTYPEIAAQLPYRDKSAAFKAVHRCLSRQESAGVDQLRRLEDLRLDHLTARLCAELSAIPVGADPHAVARLCSSLLRVSESRRRLHGLDRDASHWLKAHPGATQKLEDLKEDFTRWMEAVEADARRPIDAEIVQQSRAGMPEPAGISVGEGEEEDRVYFAGLDVVPDLETLRHGRLH